MSVSAILAVLAAGTAVCTVHLLIGYFLGRSLTRPAQPTGLAWGQVESLVRPHLAAARLVFDRAEQAAAANGGESPLPQELTASISSLIDATRLLERQLNSLAAAANRSTPRAAALGFPTSILQGAEPGASDLWSPSNARPRPEIVIQALGTTRLGLSEAELSEVTLGEGALTALPGPLDEPRRYRFQFVKRMAPCEAAFIPTCGDMRPVQCHEISTEGIAVFLEEAPEFERFAINLGDSEAGPVMLCKIDGRRAVYMYGRHGFIVDARFVRRSTPSEAPADETWRSPAAAT